MNSISKERRVEVLFSQAAVAHLLSACPMKGQEGSSCWREIKGSEPDGGASCKQRQSPPCDGAGLWRAAAQRCSAPFLCLQLRDSFFQRGSPGLGAGALTQPGLGACLQLPVSSPPCLLTASP